MDQQQRSKGLVLGVIIVLLIISTAAAGWYGWREHARAQKISQELEASHVNDKVVLFLRLFVNTVLKAETEVAFQKRLQLEDAVRALGDDEVSAQWNRFVNSQTELEAQTNTKNLLGILAEKIKVSEQGVANSQ